MDQKLREKIEEASRKYFELTSGPIYTVYADMEYLQNFRFGALIALLHKRGAKEAEACMKYIRSKIDDYNKRLDYETAKYFPALQYTEADLDAIIQSNPLGVAYISPFTSTWSILLDVMKAIRFHNDKVSQRPTNVELALNLTHVPWHPDLQARIRHTVYVAGSSDAYVTFRNMPRYTEGYDYYKSASFLFIWEIEKFIWSDPTLQEHLCRRMTFTNNQILARPYVDPKLNIAPENVQRSLVETAEILDKIMDFEWLPSSIIV